MLALFLALFRRFVDIRLHSCGAVVLHAFRYMTVHVQGERGGSVSEIALHRLDVVAVLEGQHGERMAQVMDADVRRADSRDQLLEVVAQTPS